MKPVIGKLRKYKRPKMLGFWRSRKRWSRELQNRHWLRPKLSRLKLGRFESLKRNWQKSSKKLKQQQQLPNRKESRQKKLRLKE